MRSLFVLWLLSIPALAEPPPLIGRDILFGNPERSQPKLSPDAKRLAWLAPDKNDVRQVWVKTIGKDDAKMVTADKKRGIRSYNWAWDDRTLLYLQDTDGDENFHVYGVDLENDNVRDLTPWQGVRAGIQTLDRKFPGTILVSANVRKREVFDVYRVDLKTGATVLEAENPGDIAGWLADDQMNVRAAQISTPDGGTELRVRDSAKAPWRSLLKVSAEEKADAVGFTKDGKSLYLLSTLGSDTARLVKRPLAAAGKESEIARNDQVDTFETSINPITRVVEAVAFAPARMEWKVIDPSVKADFEGIAKLDDGDYSIMSRDRADKNWVVGFTRDRGAIRWYHWDRTARKGTFLFAHQPKLEGLPLAEMKPIEITARDGMVLHAYLTLPLGGPGKNLPLVLYVHGGPWARDGWGFDPELQWLSNRGYAAIAVNYRGSDGYGKKFLHAGDKQWGKAMHTDLLDTVAWAVKEGIADPKKVAIMGGSYGGYAALAGAAFSPDVFRCAVDIVGPSNLFTLLATIPPYWKPIVSRFHTRMGDPEKDKELLTAASPLFSAKKIKIPLLIGQGANDPRVKQAESEQIFKAIADNGGRATYVLYSDEGHGFARPENRLDFFARAEAFLGAELGGRVEPIKAGDRYPGSTAVVRYIGVKK
jgi:dipeptidyl aminopeptidase/acylaminoacyl peptidase